MTREEARKAAEVMLAYANGEEVETLCSNGKYVFTKTPSFTWGMAEYRVKPKLTFRPFKTQEECWQEMIKHQPFGWVFSKNKEAITFVYYISINYIRVNDGYTLNGWTFDYEEMFDKYTFADGTPFGIKED